MKIKLTKDAKFILDLLQKYGQGFLVGGAIRDSLLGFRIKDYDFATDIEYNKLLEIFKDYSPKEIGEDFGIIQIKLNGVHYEIAKMRKDISFEQNRKNTEVEFVYDIMEDLNRRDFTLNAIAYDGEKIYSVYYATEDIKRKTINFVGNPKDRIQEDPLRMMRAIRFSCEKDLHLSLSTEDAITENAHEIKRISIERFNMEFSKILVSKNPKLGVNLLQETGILKYFIPELEKCVNFEQNNVHHDATVFEHLLDTLDNCITDDLITRLACLFHDIAKPQCYKEKEGRGTFYQHHKVGADLTEAILKRLTYSNEIVSNVKKLIYCHMQKNQKVSDKSIKKMISQVGKGNLSKLTILMASDLKSHTPPHNYESYVFFVSRVIEFISSEAIVDKKGLAINGNDLIKIGFEQGKKIGEILDYLTDIVLDDESKNDKDILLDIVKDKFK